MFKLMVFFVFIGFRFSFATPTQSFFHIETNQNLSINEFINKVSPGDVIILGESHATPGEENLDQKNQVLLIQALISKFKNISVGMEFIEFINQHFVDLYLNSNSTESEFLNKINWGQNPFDEYRLQIKLPATGSGWSYGLNSPKTLTSFVAKNGIANLPKDLASYLPPVFKIGNESYRQRFMDQMSFLSNHGANLNYYFEAQSIWDDTMAWQASEIMKSDPNQILVIIVGQFHAAYGGGLPERLKGRGIKNVITVFQSSSYKELKLDELKELHNHPKFGRLSDYYW